MVTTGNAYQKEFLSTNHRTRCCKPANQRARLLPSQTTVRSIQATVEIYHGNQGKYVVSLLEKRSFTRYKWAVVYLQSFFWAFVGPKSVPRTVLTSGNNENPGFGAATSCPRTGDHTCTCTYEKESQQDPTGKQPELQAWVTLVY